MIKKFSEFYGNLGFITVYTKPTTCPYPESDLMFSSPVRANVNFNLEQSMKAEVE